MYIEISLMLFINLLIKYYNMEIKVGIVGLGFVGGAMYKSFQNKGMGLGKYLFGYDKYNSKGNMSFDDCSSCDILFLALPTVYHKEQGQYDKGPIYEICDKLQKDNYKGVVVIKSTIEPGTTDALNGKYDLQFIHNPEFLTARTAYEDFHNQKHVVLGKAKKCGSLTLFGVKNFYETLYIDVDVSLCSCLESESMKSFVNCFYAAKVQFFTELFVLCDGNGCDFNKVKNMMLKNGWINNMHTNIPGPDGQISYGGMCFPKDTNALNEYMKRLKSPNKVLNAVIEERNEMRDDHDNCK
jgi:nucleotide sugar dehydrogenase